MISISNNSPQVARQKELLDMMQILSGSMSDLESQILEFSNNNIKMQQIKHHLKWVKQKLGSYQSEIEAIEKRKYK